MGITVLHTCSHPQSLLKSYSIYSQLSCHNEPVNNSTKKQVPLNTTAQRGKSTAEMHHYICHVYNAAPTVFLVWIRAGFCSC